MHGNKLTRIIVLQIVFKLNEKRSEGSKEDRSYIMKSFLIMRRARMPGLYRYAASDK